MIALTVPNIRNNKYTPGPLPEICAPRDKLLARFGSAAEKKVVFVTAPAGSGKTVSTLLWMRRSGRKTVWVGLDHFDNSTSIFYKMFCTGILSAQPGNERMAAILLNPAFASSPVEHTINMLAEFWLAEDEYALALDDFHNITNHEILKSLPYILRRMPHSFATFIISRTEPGESLAELAGTGQAGVIGQSELAFPVDEIGMYFASLGRSDADAEAEAAFAYTGGWAIGVNALAHSASPMPAGHGGHVLENYIKRHMWAESGESIKAFMLASAATDEIPVSLCEKTTGRPDAGELLETLRSQNIFVTRVEDGVYRYHHLFLDFLRTRPEYAKADNKKRWYMAAKHYLEKDEYLPARSYAYKSGDVKMILTAWDKFLDNRGHSFDEYLYYTQETFQEDAAEKLCELSPIFYITCAWIAFLSGDARAFEKYADHLRRSLPLILLKYPRFGELSLSLIVLDYRTPFAIQVAQAALLPPIKYGGEDMRVATLSLQMPFLHRSCRDYYEITDATLFEKMKKTFGKLLKKHFDLAMRCVGAGLCLEQNRMHEALAEAREAVSLIAKWTVNEMRFTAYMHLAAVYLALEKEEELGDLLGEIEMFISEDAQFLRQNYLAFTARANLWDGDREAATEWLGNYFVNEAIALKSYRLYQYFTTVRAYAVLGKLEKAIGLAARLRKFGEDFRRPQDAAEAGAVLAAALWADGQKEEAQATMEAVLQEMQRYSFVRLVADEGAAVLPVLKKISLKTGRPDYKGELDAVYVNNIYLAAYATSKQRKGIMANIEAKPVKLSKRQKAILCLMEQGYKREDIAMKTGLSLNTVKTHIRIAYEKLNVSNAMDAVVRARELRML